MYMSDTSLEDDSTCVRHFLIDENVEDFNTSYEIIDCSLFFFFWLFQDIINSMYGNISLIL